MPASTPNPTARRWELAARLRRLRIEAGRSVEDAARELMCSPAKISRMETAGRGVQPRDVRDLCRFYGVSDAVRDDLIQAVADARKPGWWQDFRTIDEQARTFIGLEAAATESTYLDPLRLPGPFQTSEYTRALLANLRPPGELTPGWIDEAVAVRAKRQQRVISGEFKIHAIIDEASLRRPIGSWAVMLGQIERLIEEYNRATVTLQVVPLDRGSYPGLDGSFQHLRFPPGTLGDVVYVEGLLGNFIVDKPDDVKHYWEIFEYVSKHCCLPSARTESWLHGIRKEITDRA
jgi:transcriptional regulator with XRE-family HTH domain